MFEGIKDKDGNPIDLSGAGSSLLGFRDETTGQTYEAVGENGQTASGMLVAKQEKTGLSTSFIWVILLVVLVILVFKYAKR